MAHYPDFIEAHGGEADAKVTPIGSQVKLLARFKAAVQWKISSGAPATPDLGLSWDEQKIMREGEHLHYAALANNTAYFCAITIEKTYAVFWLTRPSLCRPRSCPFIRGAPS